MISVIIPIYNEEEVFEISYKKIKDVMDNSKKDYELVFVNDGSRDKSLELLKACQEKDDKVRVLSFSRNFGHQNAVSAGMEHAKGDACIIIDADLQDPPEVIYKMIEKWDEGYEIVYGKRLKRAGETIFKKLTAFVYYRVVDSLSDVKIPKDAGDFRLIDRKAMDTIVSLKEHNRYLRGLNAWVGYKTCAVEYFRDSRAAGETKYTMKKMLKLAEDGIISNSMKPLRLPLKFGIFFGVLGTLGLLTLIVFWILSLTNVVSVAPALELWILDAVALFSSLVLTFQGITNLYIGRIYDEVRERPNYIVSEKYGFDK